MFELLIKVLSFGIASAMSPIIFGFTIATLLSKEHPIKKTFAVLLGGVLASIIIIVLALSVQEVQNSASTPRLSYVDDMLIGTFFFLFGVKTLASKDSQVQKEPKKIGFFKLFLLGFIANITNFDAVLLNFASLDQIFESSVAALWKLALILIAEFFFLSPILVPLAFFVAKPKQANKLLTPLKEIMIKYSNLIVGAILIVFGIYFIWNGALLLIG